MRFEPIKPFVVPVFLGLLVGSFSSAQPTSSKLAKAVKQTDNSSNSVKLKATSTVNSCITVEAVLLAKKPAAMLFGGFVAENYAVVKTTISNHCEDQQFILHDIYFDYRQWALSGVYPELNPPVDCPAADSAKTGEQASDDQDAADAARTRDGASESGSSSSPGTSGKDQSKTPCSPSEDQYTAGSTPGQVATVGALDVQDQETQDSVFSPRNKVIKALTIIGQVAQGYAFLGSAGAAQGIGAYNSAFVENASKLWPDRRLDQEKYLLSLGYRTDQSTAISKDDHGSYYAFFPLETFLTPSLKDLFLDDPAVFLNPAEAIFDYGIRPRQTNRSARKKEERIEPLRDLLLDLSGAVRSQFPSTCNKNTDDKTSTTCATKDLEDACIPSLKSNPQESMPADCRRELAMGLLIDLASPCPQQNCPLNKESNDYQRVLAEKYLFRHSSLNSVQIVTRGVMTIPVDSVPPIIDKVTFDGEKQGASYWKFVPATAKGAAADKTKPATKSDKATPAKTETAGADANTDEKGDTKTSAASPNEKSGEITGRFLTDATPSISAIDVPDVKDAQVKKYIVDGKVEVVSSKASETSLSFTLALAQTLPNGTKLTFEASRALPKSSSAGAKGTSTTETSKPPASNKYVYTVCYDPPPADPTLTKVIMENDTKTDVWQTPGKLSGAATGTNLADGTLSVSTLKIGGEAATVSDYISSVAEVPKTSTALSLDFELTLKKAIPDKSEMTFVVTTKSGETTLKSEPLKYTVTKPTVAPAKPKPKKPAAKPNAAH